MKTTRFPQEPRDKERFTRTFDRFYTRFAFLYEWLIRLFPIWRRWIAHVLPHIRGERLLEVSFGTGYLLDRYPQQAQVAGVDYNRKMVGIACENKGNDTRRIYLQQADVNYLPFQDGAFDTIVNTMAFTGYPDGRKAMAELTRVLRSTGRLVMVDVNYPRDANRLGVLLVRLWIRAGDLVRDMAPLFVEAGFTFEDYEIGGWGSVHLYVADKIN